MLPTTLLVVTTLTVWAEPGERPVIVEDALITTMEQVEVPASEQGIIVNMQVEEGDLVESRQVVGQIDDADVVLAARRAEIELETARAQAKNDVQLRLAKKTLSLAESELERGVKAAKLFDHAVSEEELDRKRLAVDKAKLDIEQAEHDRRVAELRYQFAANELTIAKRNLERRRILAPIDGMVVQLNRRRGEWAEPGQPLMRILRLNRLRAEGFVSAKQWNAVRPGSKVTFSTEIEGRGTVEFEGRLQFVSPEINPVDGRVRIWAEIDNRKLILRPGMLGSMAVEPLRNPDDE